jgi:hypothetical protein
MQPASLFRLALAVLVSSGGCVRGQAQPEPPSLLPSTGGGPEVLVCYAERALVYVTADGRVTRPLSPQPPEDLHALGSIGPILVGAGQGTIYAYRRGAWDLLARFGPPDYASTPVRVGSYRERALVWMRGLDAGTVPAAFSIDAQAAVSLYPVDAAQRSVGAIWQSAGVPDGPVSSGFPPAMRLFVAQVRMSGEDAKERLVHAERSWWGGILVAPDLGGRGDWPTAPLLLLRDPERGTPVPLLYEDAPITLRGLIGYAGDQYLYIDGRFSSLGRGLLRVRPPHRQPSRDRLVAERLPGLSAPCAVLPPQS